MAAAQHTCSNGGAEGSHRLAQQAPSRSAAAAILTAPNRNSENDEDEGDCVAPLLRRAGAHQGEHPMGVMAPRGPDLGERRSLTSGARGGAGEEQKPPLLATAVGCGSAARAGRSAGGARGGGAPLARTRDGEQR